MKKRVATIKIHSIIDVITNSSTELFCTVEGTEESLRNILTELCGNHLFEYGDGISINEVEIYNEVTKDYEIKKGFYNIDVDYNFPCCQCKLLKTALKEKFPSIEFDED
jgi:hypothetical protein